jgi:hypothetical protein
MDPATHNLCLSSLGEEFTATPHEKIFICSCGDTGGAEDPSGIDKWSQSIWMILLGICFSRILKKMSHQSNPG